MYRNKQIGGSAIGGILGGVLGSQVGGGSGKVASSAVGVVLGSLLGGSIGQQLDERDKQLIGNSSSNALEYARDDQRIEWKNPNTGNYGYTQPVRTYRANNGYYCREYTQEINVGGKIQQGYGRACRMPDGAWKIVQ
ncbi:MAG TPA: RT0821/Lpp0805 family surface protein [Candidatus Megaira endosymbiont of Hartmannula sinica]|nr:RT0821/Lpp0805 family surface protein [Candidatus Megaera endosymbiont of Hartmannula sinica]